MNLILNEVNKLSRIFLSLLIVFSLTFTPIIAFADPEEEQKTGIEAEEIKGDAPVHPDLINQYNIWQDEVEEANKNYQEKLKSYNEIKERISQSEKELEEIKEKLEYNQDIVKNNIIQRYKASDDNTIINILSFIFESKSFKEFSTKIDYMEKVEKPFREAVKESKELKLRQEELIAQLEEDKVSVEEEYEAAASFKGQIDEVSDDLKNLIDESIGSNGIKMPPVPEGGYDNVIEAAYSRIGAPYVWGAPRGDDNVFDCSSLTQWCYVKTYGKWIGHTTFSQNENPEGEHVSLDKALPGDVLFRGGGSAETQHVAIYIGNNKYIHAPCTGRLVCISEGIDSFNYAIRFNYTK